MAGDGDLIRCRDSTEIDYPLEKKPKIETDPEAKTEAPSDSFVHNGRVILMGGEEDDPERKRQLALFAKQLKDSEGFDVEWDRFDYKFSVVNFDWKPTFEDGRSKEELMEQLIQAAIEEYDEIYDTKLQSAKYVSANIVGCKGLLYYITFSAVDIFSSDQKPKLYQAKVWKYREEITVPIVRLRPSQRRS